MPYFRRVRSPFTLKNREPKRKIAKISDACNELDIVKCCYTFLNYNPVYFKHAWKWSNFIHEFCIGGQYDENHMYTYICNRILALLWNMTEAQLKELNHYIPVDVQVEFEVLMSKNNGNEDNDIETQLQEGSESKLYVENDLFTSIEGVMLPISNHKYSSIRNDKSFIMVDSTRLNLRSLSIGIASSKAICLSGPVGSGKTSLVQYLASKTGRTSSFLEMEHQVEINKNANGEFFKDAQVQEKSLLKDNKRKIEQVYCTRHRSSSYVGPKFDQFLRIQFGDQTDSKVLLGQYRCTDVPGEFVWQAGVLTQAVMNGSWLLLEDLDLCTQDACMVLLNLLETGYLSVPGFRNRIQITSGFQLFFTLRLELSVYYISEFFMFVICLNNIIFFQQDQ